MSHRIDDRWLWLGFGVFFLLAAGGVRYAIRDVIWLTRLERHPDERDIPELKKPEDDISLEDLKILTESTNTNISNAAMSLVVDRLMRRPDYVKSIMADADSKDETTRIRARKALEFLRHWSGMLDSTLPRYPRSRTYSGESTSSSVMPAFNEGQATLPQDNEAIAGVSSTAGLNVVIPSDDNPVAGWTNVPRERPAEDEAARRRRRREAMVLRESAGGVEEADIIRPNLSS